MNNDIDTRPTLFILEDDPDLGEEIEAIARGAGYAVSSARCVEEAMARFPVIGGIPPRLVLVDMMVPSNKAQLELLDELVKSRNEYILQKAQARSATELTDEQIAEIGRKLDGLDQKIRQQIDLEGGLDFLDRVRQEHRLEGARVAIFSGRTELSGDSRLVALKDHLRDRWVGWLQKPLHPDRLVDLLTRYNGAGA